MDLSTPSKRQKLSYQTQQNVTRASPAPSPSFLPEGPLGGHNLTTSHPPVSALLPARVSSLSHISQATESSSFQSLSPAHFFPSTHFSSFLTAPSVSVDQHSSPFRQQQILPFTIQTRRDLAALPPRSPTHEKEDARISGCPPIPVSSSAALSRKDSRAPREKIIIDLTDSPPLPPISSTASPSSPSLRHLLLDCAQNGPDPHDAESADPSHCLALKLQAQFDNEESQVIADFHLSQQLMQNQDLSWGPRDSEDEDARLAQELQEQFDMEAQEDEEWPSPAQDFDSCDGWNKEAFDSQDTSHEVALSTRIEADGLNDFHIPRQVMTVSSIQPTLPAFVSARTSMLCSRCKLPLLNSAEGIMEHIKVIKSHGKRLPRVDASLQCKACSAFTCLGCGAGALSEVGVLAQDDSAPNITSCCEQWRLSLIWLLLWAWELQVQSQHQSRPQTQPRPTKGRHRSHEGTPKKKSATRRSQRPDGVGYGGPAPHSIPFEYLVGGSPIHPAMPHPPNIPGPIPPHSSAQTNPKTMNHPSSHSSLPLAFQVTSGGPSSDHGLQPKYQSLFNKHPAHYQSPFGNHQGHGVGNISSVQPHLPPEHYTGVMGNFPMVQPYTIPGYHGGGMSNPPMMQSYSNSGSYSDTQRKVYHDSFAQSGHPHLHLPSQAANSSLPALPEHSYLNSPHMSEDNAIFGQSARRDDLPKLQTHPTFNYGAGPSNISSTTNLYGINGNLANFTPMQPCFSLPPHAAATEPTHPSQIHAVNSTITPKHVPPYAGKGSDHVNYKPKKPLIQFAQDVFDDVAKMMNKTSLPPVCVKEESDAATRDQELMDVFDSLCELLPSADKGTSLFDVAPPPELLAMLALSSVLDEVAELLRNDSIVDATKRQGLYHGLIKLVIQLANHDATHDVILKDRPQKTLRLSRFEHLKDTKKELSETEHVSSIAASMKNIVKQSRMVLRSSRDENNQILGDDARDMLLLCSRLEAMAEVVSRRSVHLSHEPVSDPPLTRNHSKADKAQEWQDWQKANCMLDVPDEVILKTHKYAKEATLVTQCPRGRMKRLIEESANLSTSLPPGIFVRYASSRPDVLKVLIVGPSGTPYEGGLFEFDAWCPGNYPQEPPRFTFKTTGAGRSRFNPNLYECGKVCLSLLNTWPGETWKPNESTLLQVLVSLQSMVFCDQPYYNEPGHEGRENAKASELYDRRIKGLTLRLAMTSWLHHGSQTIWAQVIKQHFQRNRQDILQLARRWANEGAANEAGELEKALGKVG